MSIHFGGRGPGHIARVQGGGPTKSLDFSTSLPSGVTFSRGSSATYFDSAGVLQTASSNVARIDYNPATLVSRGLLIEEARTNLLLRSAEFNNAAWVDISVGTTTVSSDYATAPDGASAADRLQGNNANTWFAQVVGTGHASTTKTFSVWAKSNSGSPSGVNLILSFSGGSVYTSGITVTSTWQRFTFTQAFGAGDTGTLRAGINHGNGNDISVWGAQLETGAFATSYIPTAGSTVARSADSASMTGTDFSSWWNATEGTFYFEGDSPGSGTRPLVSADDNTANEKFDLYTSTLDPKFLITDGGATQADIDAGSITANTAFKFAAAFKANDCSVSVNGGAEVNDASATIPTVDRLRIGADQAGNSLNGHVKTFRFYATNKDTQALTA